MNDSDAMRKLDGMQKAADGDREDDEKVFL
jgi:hypothetical protein